MKASSETFDKKDFEIISEAEIYKGFTSLKELHLKHRLFLGGWSDPIRRELVLRRAAAGLLPYDPERDQVVMISSSHIK